MSTGRARLHPQTRKPVAPLPGEPAAFTAWWRDNKHLEMAGRRADYCAAFTAGMYAAKSNG